MQETQTDRPDWLMFIVGFVGSIVAVVAVVKWSVGLAVAVLVLCGAFAWYRHLRPHPHRP